LDNEKNNKDELTYSMNNIHSDKNYLQETINNDINYFNNSALNLNQENINLQIQQSDIEKTKQNTKKFISHESSIISQQKSNISTLKKSTKHLSKEMRKTQKHINKSKQHTISLTHEIAANRERHSDINHKINAEKINHSFNNQSIVNQMITEDDFDTNFTEEINFDKIYNDQKLKITFWNEYKTKKNFKNIKQENTISFDIKLNKREKKQINNNSLQLIDSNRKLRELYNSDLDTKMKLGKDLDFDANFEELFSQGRNHVELYKDEIIINGKIDSLREQFINNSNQSQKKFAQKPKNKSYGKNYNSEPEKKQNTLT